MLHRTSYPLSRRLATKDVDGSVETHFYGPGWETYADLDEDLSPTRVYVTAGGMDRQAAMLAKDGAEWRTYYYLRDHLGSVIALVDEDGDVVESYEYEPYGMPTVSTVAGDAVTTGRASSVGNRFLFSGREWDAALEMYHFRYRTYSPRDRRFMQDDPIGLGGGWNVYAYCGGNPVNVRDALGLFLFLPLEPFPMPVPKPMPGPIMAPKPLPGPMPFPYPGPIAGDWLPDRGLEIERHPPRPERIPEADEDTWWNECAEDRDSACDKLIGLKDKFCHGGKRKFRCNDKDYGDAALAGRYYLNLFCARLRALLQEFCYQREPDKGHETRIKYHWKWANDCLEMWKDRNPPIYIPPPDGLTIEMRHGISS